MDPQVLFVRSAVREHRVLLLTFVAEPPCSLKARRQSWLVACP
jgi:hypothetical protein